MKANEHQSIEMLLDAHQEDAGQCLDPSLYPHSTQGLESFLGDLGEFPYLSAEEIVKPHHRDIAKELGYDEFVPPQESWVVVGCLALIHHQCRILAEGPVHVRNCYRPSAYNARVGGSAGSDHLNGRAFDMDFKTPEACQRALKYVRSLYKHCPELELSMGVGRLTIHVGVLSDNGHRRWSY